MASPLDRHTSTLKLLSRANQNMAQNILKSAGDNLIKCICDCTLNTLKRNVRVSPKQKSKLKRHKKILCDLAKKKVSFKRKRQIMQKGGFLAQLLSAVIPAIASLLTGFSRR